jgi:diguanylate cyclase (GGDEF)-like protein
VLTAAWTGEENVDGALIEPLGGLADQAALALQNASLLGRIRHQSLHDALTGLPNRLHFADRLDVALAAPPPAPAAVAVLFCDLDHFKVVNDTLGHVAGDELLRQVAERLRASVRAEDVVARLAGDEFAVLLPSVPSEKAARAVADAVERAFDLPFVVDGHELDVTASVGVALQDDLEGTADGLQRRADAAMYEAKSAGRNRVATSA